MPSLYIDGEHQVFIAAISETEEKPCERFKDRTPRLTFTLKGTKATGTLKYSLNLIDYKTADQYTEEEQRLKRFKFDYNGTKYEIDEDGYRIPCNAKNEQINDLIGYIANQCGFEEGQTISLHDFLGKHLIIRVKDKQITHTLSYEHTN
jgi:hypothetical protein